MLTCLWMKKKSSMMNIWYLSLQTKILKEWLKMWRFVWARIIYKPNYALDTLRKADSTHHTCVRAQICWCQISRKLLQTTWVKEKKHPDVQLKLSRAFKTVCRSLPMWATHIHNSLLTCYYFLSFDSIGNDVMLPLSLHQHLWWQSGHHGWLWSTTTASLTLQEQLWFQSTHGW